MGYDLGNPPESRIKNNSFGNCGCGRKKDVSLEIPELTPYQKQIQEKYSIENGWTGEMEEINDFENSRKLMAITRYYHNKTNEEVKIDEPIILHISPMNFMP